MGNKEEGPKTGNSWEFGNESTLDILGHWGHGKPHGLNLRSFFHSRQQNGLKGPVVRRDASQCIWSNPRGQPCRPFPDHRSSQRHCCSRIQSWPLYPCRQFQKDECHDIPCNIWTLLGKLQNWKLHIVGKYRFQDACICGMFWCRILLHRDPPSCSSTCFQYTSMEQLPCDPPWICNQWPL